MGRLRNAGRVWRQAGPAAARLMMPCDGSYFTVDINQLFGRRVPLEVEIGAGRGDFIIDRAAAMADHDFLAIESAATVAQLIAIRASRHGLANLRVIRMDARSLVNLMLPDASVSAYHIYFPDPWPKERHVKHRLFTPTLAASLFRTVEPGAIAYVATDVRNYAGEIFPMMEAAGFIRAVEAAPGSERTGFARKYVAAGKPVFSASFRKPRESKK